MTTSRDQPVIIATRRQHHRADIARALADGKDLNNVRIYELRTSS